MTDQDPWVLSASQVETFRECPRKWGWEKIEGFKQAEKLSTAFGTEVHALLERYLKDGTPPNRHTPWRWDGKTLYPGATALTMMGPHLAKPGIGTTEGEFKWHDEENDIHWRGFIDHWQYMKSVPYSMMSEEMREALPPPSPSRGPEVLDMPYTLVKLTDHKTSVDPVKYGKTEETLRTAAQRVLYARALVATQGFAQAVVTEAVWNYGSRDSKPSKARVVRVYEHEDETMKRYHEELVPLAKKVLHAKATAKSALELEPHPEACEMYGGCPHKDRCKLTDAQKIGAFIMGGSLIDELLGEAEGTEDVVETEGEAVAPEEEEAVAEVKPVKPTKRKPRKKKEAKDAVNPPEGAPELMEEVKNCRDAPKSTMDSYDEAMANAIADLVVERIAGALAKLAAK